MIPRDNSRLRRGLGVIAGGGNDGLNELVRDLVIDVKAELAELDQHSIVAAVAQANKNARIVWAMLASDDKYRPGLAT